MILRYFLIFISLIISQVIVFNNIQFSSYINPAFYILFIFLLPLNTPAWLRLISAFILGFIIDMFSQSPGLHTSATVLIAFLQPGIISFFKATDIDIDKSNSLSRLGFQWFSSSLIVMVLIHQLSYFILEIFSFNHFLDTFYRVIFSTFATFIAILLAQLVIYKKQQ